jgi:hypothetical protein
MKTPGKLFGILFFLSVALLNFCITLDHVNAQDGGELPQHGWMICEDLGMTTVPGFPGEVPLLGICQGQGWRVQAYCIEPEKNAPGLGAPCSLDESGTFWCGDKYQLLQLLQVLETPVPTSPPTHTSTSTQTPTNTPAPTQRRGVEATQPVATATIYYRPPAGGEGNMIPFVIPLTSAIVMISLGSMGLIRWIVRKKY